MLADLQIKLWSMTVLQAPSENLPYRKKWMFSFHSAQHIDKDYNLPRFSEILIIIF